MHLIAKFHRPTFNRSEVIVWTNKHIDWQRNKQTPLKTSTSLRNATPVGKQILNGHFVVQIMLCVSVSVQTITFE